MRNYLLIILVLFNAVALTNGIVLHVGITAAYLETTLMVGLLAAVDAVVAILTRLIPADKLNYEAWPFVVSQKERNFYRTIHVDGWKDLVPEIGKYLCNFAKDKVYDPTNNEYIRQFLVETCYAEIMHFWSAFLPLFYLILIPIPHSIMLPAILTNMFLQILPTIVQRYNRPRLLVLYRRNLRHQAVSAPIAPEFDELADSATVQK